MNTVAIGVKFGIFMLLFAIVIYCRKIRTARPNPRTGERGLGYAVVDKATDFFKKLFNTHY
ncbi:MAG: hypothetical protein AAGK47_06335, partial [Bacteroidota bacterium]